MNSEAIARAPGAPLLLGALGVHRAQGALGGMPQRIPHDEMLFNSDWLAAGPWVGAFVRAHGRELSLFCPALRGLIFGGTPGGRVPDRRAGRAGGGLAPQEAVSSYRILEEEIQVNTGAARGSRKMAVKSIGYRRRGPFSRELSCVDKWPNRG